MPKHLPSRHVRLLLLTALTLAGRPTDAQILGDLEIGDAFGSALATGDFNGDGFPDLAVGVYLEDVFGVSNAGAVNVLYGSASGLTTTGNQFWHQNSPGIGDTAETGDGFGSALAAGDFDGDGYDDLAIGVPLEDLVENPAHLLSDAGAIHVLYGSPDGLTAARSRFGHRDSPGVAGTAGVNARFGSALAAGDFDGDGYADLAVGAPNSRVGESAFAGSVSVFYGSASGLRVAGNELWSQDSPGVEDDAEPNDAFGNALAVGDFDGDGYDDLAVGARGETVSGFEAAGAVNVLYGSAAGLRGDGSQFWHQDSPGILDQAELEDVFGWSLAVGDFDGDGFSDLAVGVYQEDVFGVSNAGAVNVLYGSASGLTADGNQFWHQDSPGIEDQIETSDHFGYALASGDFDGDGFSDLAVGVPREDFGDISSAGAANVLYGSPAGLSADGNQFWHQERDGLPDLLETGDRFGHALAAGDFDGDGFSDLAVGVPEEGIGAVNRAGAVNVLYGTGSGGLSAVGNQFWYQGATAAAGSEAGRASAAMPATHALGAPAPNPSDGRATFRLEVAEAQAVRVEVLDALGRRVAVLHAGTLAAGSHPLTLDGVALPAGVYVVRAEAGGVVATRTVTLVR
jgi:hypothetical protein